MLAWIDLEATGLVAAAHAVLEVAAIVTDDRLRELGRFHRVVHWPGAERLAHLGADSPGEAIGSAAASTGLDLVVVEMHARTGLWGESARSPHHLTGVDDQLAEFLAAFAAPAVEESAPASAAARPQIAGSSIWFDRGLMAVRLPGALAQLHYRSVDVTTLNECARRFWPDLYGGRPARREIHRALPDIEDSLSLCRYYADRIADVPSDAAKALR